jgi:ubiquinone/menaquinone biosynthesis C-methylase UbiE
MLLAEVKSTLEHKLAPYYDFDRIAGCYDDWYNSATGVIYDHLEKRTIGKLLGKERCNGKLLEVGCGTGHWSRYFSDKGFEVTGVDVSREMIEIANQKHIPNSRFEIADGQNLPFADESFDVAAAITALEFTSDPTKIISEMARCVKKSSGILIIGALNILSGYNQKRKKISGNVYSAANLFSPQQIRDLLSRYGLPRTQTTGFIPEKEWLLGISPLWELLGHLFRPQRGVFIAARVDL